jgi:hypothetical protein
MIDLGDVTVTVVLDAGPRILGYADRGGPQLFAALPGEVIDKPGGFEFIGGHRLWRAPEIPAVTYRSDNDPVVVDRVDDGVRITGAPDADLITKTITLRQLGAMTVVDHTLLNQGIAPVRCAAWAITQLAPGGTAVLPQSLTPADVGGVLPNRAVVLWPYTDPSAPDIEFRSSELRIHASDTAEKSKIGQANRRGWTAYEQGDRLFVKWSPLHQDSRDYADLGASVECYRDQRFLELESLGPLTDLEPGETLHHREVWTLIRLEERPLDEVLASLPEQPAEMVD